MNLVLCKINRAFCPLHLLIGFLLFAYLIPAQNSCGDKQQKENKRFIEKAARKNKPIHMRYANAAFDIAECYRQNNDTNALHWYKKTISLVWEGVGGCGPRSPEMLQAMHNAGRASFYLGNYRDAEAFFQKSIAAAGNPENHYFLGLTFLKKGNYPEAEVEFLDYQKLVPQGYDVTDLLKESQLKQSTEYINAANHSKKAPVIPAEFPGGYKKLMDYFKTEITRHSDQSVLEKVILGFYVDETGKATQAMIIKSCGDAALDKIFLDAVNRMPQWTPAQDPVGKTVGQEFTLPMYFCSR